MFASLRLSAAVLLTALAASTSPVKASATLTGLKTKTTYYFQFVVSTAAGSVLGPVLSFTTN